MDDKDKLIRELQQKISSLGSRVEFDILIGEGKLI